jgi:hypothetical protein
MLHLEWSWSLDDGWGRRPLFFYDPLVELLNPGWHGGVYLGVGALEFVG